MNISHTKHLIRFRLIRAENKGKSLLSLLNKTTFNSRQITAQAQSDAQQVEMLKFMLALAVLNVLVYYFTSQI